MAEFDEKLNSILSNPDAMSQIMQLAQSLSGGGQDTAPAQPIPPQPQQQESSPWQSPPPPQQSRPVHSPPSGASGDLLSSLTGGIDPTLLMKLVPLVQELGRDSGTRQLLYALRPYLKNERQEKIERALQLARLFHIGKKFLSEWEG